MSIKAYVGRMGSGKTYEVVSVVILGALARGRRVITNIAGIDYQAMADMLVAEGIEANAVGSIVNVTHERVCDADFWLTESRNEAIKAQGVDAAVLSVQPGDLLALDEIWRFWGGFALKDAEGSKRPPEVMNFFRMHRHFTHPDSGISCDVALITQDVMDISRQVRAVIEETYRMEKLTAIGSARRYRVDVCQGGQSRKVLRSLQRSYEDKYFGLYKSHSGHKEGDAGPVEENIDQRGNILKGALFRFVLPIGALVMLLGIWTVWKFLHPAAKPDKPEDKSAAVVASPEQAVSHAKPRIDESDRWRVVGWIARDSRMLVVLADGNRQRIIEPPNMKLTGSSLEAFLPSGEAVAPWTGGQGRGIIDQAAGRP